MKLKGKKVILVTPEEKLVPLFWKWINDKNVIRYLSGPFPKTLSGEMKWFRETQKKKNEKMFTILDMETGRAIGNIGIHNISETHRNADIGILIGEKAFWGKGYGRDAFKTALNYCFKRLKLHKIRLSVFPKNKGAIKCYKRCGFKKTGVEQEEFLKNGRFYDVILMELTVKNFKF